MPQKKPRKAKRKSIYASRALLAEVDHILRADFDVRLISIRNDIKALELALKSFRENGFEQRMLAIENAFLDFKDSLDRRLTLAQSHEFSARSILEQWKQDTNKQLDAIWKGIDARIKALEDQSPATLEAKRQQKTAELERARSRARQLEQELATPPATATASS